MALRQALFSCLPAFLITFILDGSIRPNILWITSEDNSISWVSCYGSKNAQTPNIDQLAKEGFRYEYCFDNAAVCAPTRSMWITGMYPVSNGTQPMRSRNKIPHDKILYYPDLLKKAGYYTSNPGKTDYNIGGRADKECWDNKKGNHLGWREMQDKSQPFFVVFNIQNSHESGAFADRKKTRIDPENVSLYQYHPDLPAIRKNYAEYGDAVAEMDKKVKYAIDALKEDGLYDDTIIIYNSDHGGVMPRSKRFLYSSGIHCPLIIRIPEKYKHLYPADKPGMSVDRLVSFVDMPKTWLSLAGAEIPETFQGTIFLGKDMEPELEYHFAFRERADERLDNVRVIRDKRFAYHKNYYPFAPAGQFLPYLWKAKAAPAWEAHHAAGKTNDVTGRFFRARVSEEFYDNQKDFDNVENLIDSAEHKSRIAVLRKELRKKQLELFDSGMIPEEMRNRRAKKNGLTIYEFVRNKELYPLEKYLDAADKALSRNRRNLDSLIAMLSDLDAGIRWWGIVGLHLLEKHGNYPIWWYEEALKDEAHEIQCMAAWALIKHGKKEKAMECLEDLLLNGTHNELMLHNVIDWMGEPGLPLVKKYFANGGKRMNDRGNKISIFGRIAELNGF